MFLPSHLSIVGCNGAWFSGCGRDSLKILWDFSRPWRNRCLSFSFNFLLIGTNLLLFTELDVLSPGSGAILLLLWIIRLTVTVIYLYVWLCCCCCFGGKCLKLVYDSVAEYDDIDVDGWRLVLATSSAPFAAWEVTRDAGVLRLPPPPHSVRLLIVITHRLSKRREGRKEGRKEGRETQQQQQQQQQQQ